MCDVDGNGGDARLGARRDARERAGKDAKHRIHPRLFRCLEFIRPFPGREPPASGPGPVTNRSRWPYIVNQQPSTFGGSPGLPPSTDGQGVSDYDQLVGDYTNPILQPWAAEVVKKFGEISLAEITYPEPVQPVLA